MTNSKQYLSKPSPRMRRVLIEMAEERGVSFTPPRTAAQARTEFRRLKAIPRQDRLTRSQDVRAVRGGLARSTVSSDVRAEETTGHGSSAAWSSAVEDD